MPISQHLCLLLNFIRCYSQCHTKSESTNINNKSSHLRVSQVVLVVKNLKNLPANTEDIRDTGLIPGSGRSAGRGKGNPL